jgi:hypothetical protein
MIQYKDSMFSKTLLQFIWWEIHIYILQQIKRQQRNSNDTSNTAMKLLQEKEIQQENKDIQRMLHVLEVK